MATLLDTHIDGEYSLNTSVNLEDMAGFANCTTTENSVSLLESLINPGAAGNTDDNFGYSVSCSSTRIVVGAYKEDGTTSDEGRAYVYDIDGNLLHTLINPGAAGNSSDAFGHSVSCSDTRIVIGANSEDGTTTNEGRAYVYDINGNLISTLINPGAAGNSIDAFGISVSCSDTRIVVGANGEDGTTDNEGRAYVYDIDGNLISTLYNPGAAGNGYDNFGRSVACSDTRIVVGAYQEDGTTSDEGRVYVYNLNGTLLHTLINPGAAGNDYDNFGYSVACSNTRVVVGAYGEDGTTTNEGRAYVYDINGNLISTLINPGAAGNGYDNFGASVSCSDTRIVVGANGEDGTTDNEGRAYVYDIDGNLLHTLINPGAAGNTDDRFGVSVSCSNSRIVVGAYNEDGTTVDEGRAYVYDLQVSKQTSELQNLLDYYKPDILGIRTLYNPGAVGNSGDRFGISVSCSDTRIVVGARSEDGTTTDEGRAYVYDLNGNLLNTLINPGAVGNSGDSFGYSVACSDTRIVVGATGEDGTTDGEGRAYVYDIDGNLISTLINPGAAGNVSDYFGASVSCSDTRIVVGSYLEDGTTDGEGRVYVYDIDGNLLHTLYNPGASGNTFDKFGNSVSCSDTRIVVGANSEDGTTSDEGRVYVYDLNGNLISTLINPGAAGNTKDYFGISVSCSDTRIVVGAEREDGTTTDEGRAYVYDIDGNLLHTLINPGASGNVSDRFANSVTCSDTRIVVGTYLEDGTTTNEGRAYIYDIDGNLLHTLYNPGASGNTYDYFGASVSCSDTRIVVGSYQEDGTTDNEGRAYVYYHNGQ